MRGAARTFARPTSTGLMSLSLILLSAGWLAADVLHLKNGRRLEGVILEETSSRILLKLAFGEIGLPPSSIERIERGRTDLQEYLERRSALRREKADANRWLELALWADQQGLNHSCREAALVAARLEPGLPQLAPLMTALGYAMDEKLAMWIPYDELMRRRGYVLSEGRWLSPDQQVALHTARQAAAANALERQRQERLARAVELMVLAKVAEVEESRRQRQQALTTRYGLPLWGGGGYPVVVAPGHWPEPPLRPEALPKHPADRTDADRSVRRHIYPEAMLSRPPGSLIPFEPARTHRGGFQPPPGRR